jgi:hypothetical protein
MLTTWVNKLQLEVSEDHEDGGCTITIEWDENDPDLDEWTSWGPEKQKAFVIETLSNAVSDALASTINNVSATESHVV